MVNITPLQQLTMIGLSVGINIADALPTPKPVKPHTHEDDAKLAAAIAKRQRRTSKRKLKSN